MTFSLKDFNSLKIGFEAAIKHILECEGKTKVNELAEKRKEEILFIQVVISQLEQQFESAEPTPQALAYASKVIAGALLLMEQDIIANLGRFEYPEGSLLYQSIHSLLGKNENNIPDSCQVTEYMRALNKFLEVIYEGGDSRNGLSSENIFYEINPKRFASFLKLSYEFEAQNYKTYTEQGIGKSVTQQTHINKHPFRARAIIAPSSPLIENKDFGFDRLKASLDQVMILERRANGVSDITQIKNKTRAVQLQFLEKLANHLDTKSALAKEEFREPTRIAILAGAMLLVREEISMGEYKSKKALDKTTTGSVVHTELSKILALDKLSSEDALIFMQTTHQYLTTLMLERLDIKGRAFKDVHAEKHIFSDIKKFSASEVLSSCENMIAELRKVSFKRCVKEEAEKQQATKQTSKLSYWSAGFLGKKTTPRPVVKPESKEEHSEDEETSALGQSL